MKTNKKIEIGSLLHVTWTGLRYHYFQVVEIKNNFCVVREIEDETTKTFSGGWQFNTKPKANAFIGKPMRKLIKTDTKYDMGDYVVIDGKCAFIWDGKDDYNDMLD